MTNRVGETVGTMQGEYTFPDLISSSECKELWQMIKQEEKPYKIKYKCSLAACVIFGGLGYILLLLGLTDIIGGGAIICGAICCVLCIAAIIFCVPKGKMCKKYDGELNYLNYCINTNSQYSAFINQGYEKKEAYKLTLEWLDRQANISAMNSAANSIASTNALIAMSNIANKR